MFGKRTVLSTSWIAILFVATQLLTSCGTGGDSTASAPSASEAVKQQVSNEPVEISFYSASASEAMNEQFGAKYGDQLHKRFPQYTFKYIVVGNDVSLPEMIAGGTKFDIYFGSIGNFEEAMLPNDMQVDMTPLIKKHNVDLDAIDKTLVDAVRQASGGKLFGLPVETNTLTMFYNKSLFDKFGVPYPKDGMTWDDVTELAKRMTRTDSGVQYYGYSTSTKHLARMNQMSIPDADLKTNTPTINKDDRWKTLYTGAVLNPISGYLDLFRSGKIKKLPNHTDNFMKNQDLAMYNYQLTLLSTYEDIMKGLNWDMVSTPVFKEKPGVGAQMYPTYFGLTKWTRNPDAAMEVLKYMVSDEYQKNMGIHGMLTVLKSQAVKDAFIKESTFKDHNLAAVFHYPFAPIPPKGLYDAKLIDAYDDALNKDIIIAGTDINTAFRKAEDKATASINEFLSQGKGK
jgi:multiple sugar transport system substrate-binding protein